MERKSRLQPLARAVLRTQSDHRLVALTRDGKEAAFEEIVRRYRPALVAFAAAFGPPDPEDVVQESLLRSWDALRESTGEMHLKAWLYTIVRNRALNARRDSRPHEQLNEELDGVPQPPEIVLSNDELQGAVVAIGALPATQREALVRSALEGHTHDQIAAAIGSTPGAVRQLIYRARLTVRHGVGAVIPLPVVAALAEAGGAGAALGGAAAAGAAGGASLAAKTAVVAAIGAVAIGSGAAIKQAADSDSGGDQAPRSAVERDRAPDSGDGSGPAVAPTADTSEPVPQIENRSGNRGEGSGGSSGPGEDGSGGDDDSGSSGPGSEPGDDSSGSGSGSGDDSPNSGPGSDSSGSGHGGSGSGGSGPDDAEGGSSGPGSGDDSGLEREEPLDGDNSGPGGGGGSGSSGSGGGGELDDSSDDSSGSGGGDGSGSGSGELEPPDVD